MACCLLIVLEVLLSGLGTPSSGEERSHNPVVSGETLGNAGETLLPETDSDFLIPAPADAGFVSYPVTLLFFPCIQQDRIGPVRSSGWLMPARI